MTTKRKPQVSKKPKPNNLTVTEEQGKSQERKLAEVQFSPTIINTVTSQSFLKSITGEVDLTEAVDVMQEKSDKILAGDLSELESTLAAQIVSLNAIFSTLAKRSASCEYVNQMEINMRLALKAQSQCARTAEVLAAIKNPPVVYAKQANIAQGHQQVNNGITFPPHAEKNKNLQNELLSETNNETVVTRGTAKTGRVNQEMEAVGAINGRKNRSR